MMEDFWLLRCHSQHYHYIYPNFTIHSYELLSQLKNIFNLDYRCLFFQPYMYRNWVLFIEMWVSRIKTSTIFLLVRESISCLTPTWMFRNWVSHDVRSDVFFFNHLRKGFFRKAKWLDRYYCFLVQCSSASLITRHYAFHLPLNPVFSFPDM